MREVRPLAVVGGCRKYGPTYIEYGVGEWPAAGDVPVPMGTGNARSPRGAGSRPARKCRAPLRCRAPRLPLASGDPLERAACAGSASAAGPTGKGWEGWEVPYGSVPYLRA